MRTNFDRQSAYPSYLENRWLPGSTTIFPVNDTSTIGPLPFTTKFSLENFTCRRTQMSNLAQTIRAEE